MVKFILDLTVVSALWEKSTVFEFVNMPQERHPSPCGENVDHSHFFFTILVHLFTTSSCFEIDQCSLNAVNFTELILIFGARLSVLFFRALDIFLFGKFSFLRSTRQILGMWNVE